MTVSPRSSAKRSQPFVRSFSPLLSWLARLGGAVAIVWCLAGCNSIPPGRSAVDEVQVRGTNKIDSGDVADKIATTETSKFLGIKQGFLNEYSLFDRNVLQRDLARVEAFYRTKGYYEAHARAGRVHVKDDKHVRVEILVEEGEAIRVRTVRVDGLDQVPKDIADIVRRAVETTLKKDEPFEEEVFDKALEAARRSLTDRGYAYTKAKHDATIDIVEHKVDVVIAVTPGEPCVFGPVTVEGLGPLPEKPVRRALDIEEGAPFSEAVLEAAQQAVLDFGVFASVDMNPDLPDPPRPDHVVPIQVKVEASRLRTLRLGGGLEFDFLKSDVHGVFGWENRNFLGGFRTFTVNFKPGVVLYPLRFNNFVAPTHFLPEERLRLEFRQPGFLEARTNLFVRPEFNVQALLLSPNPPEGAPVIGYAEARNAIGLDRTYTKFYGAISHNVQVAYPFAYVGKRDETLSLVVISYPELVTSLDLRNDRIHPRKGIYILNTLQVAGGPFGGQAKDVKIQPDVRGYIPIAKRVVFAARGSLGLLLPSNYGQNVRGGASVFDNSEDRTKDYQLTFFRGFFSGGPTSNRGYPLRGVGPHDTVPFLSPEAQEANVNNRCSSGSTSGTTDTSNDCRSPTGGFTLWEASAELRFKVGGPLSIATFCDASDVSPRTTDIRFKHLHLSCGAGGRYDTPVGPIRLDIGYRIPGMQVIGGLTPDERDPKKLLGIPIAVSLGIGEAY